MKFTEALKILRIEEYSDRIFNSNSHGELVHLYDYIFIAENIGADPLWFKDWFRSVVDHAEQNWERPESVFQHINKFLLPALEC